MELLYGISIALMWIIGVILSRIITTYIHELGHAIPALIFTEKEVAIHIGSYGDDKNSFQWSFGRLKTFFKFDIINWNIGLCQHKGTSVPLHNIIIVLGGPVFSLLIGIVMFLIIYFGNWSDGMITIFTFFILASLYDFFVNIIPIDYPIPMHDGTAIYNDGMVFKSLLQSARTPKHLQEAEDLFFEKKYEESIILLEKFIEEGYDKKDARLILIDAYRETKNLDAAFEQVDILRSKKQLKDSDLNWQGDLFLEKHDYNNAIKCYNQYLYKKRNNIDVLFKKGYSYFQLADYQEAFNNFNSILVYKSNHISSLSFRGMAKIKLGEVEEGYADLKNAATLDNGTDAYLQLHLGYYFQKINDPEKAIEHFKKAKELEIDFHGIDYLIETTQ